MIDMICRDPEYYLWILHEPDRASEYNLDYEVKIRKNKTRQNNQKDYWIKIK